MNLYLIEQDVNTGATYGSAVVIAKSEKAARKIHPNDYQYFVFNWTEPENVKVTYLGPFTKADGWEGQVICASFNAG